MNDLQSLLESVRRHPYDRTARLSVADYLESDAEPREIEDWLDVSATEITGAKLADWIRLQWELHTTEPVWKAGTILGRRRLMVQDCPPFNANGKAGVRPSVTDLPPIRETWGELEPYSPDVDRAQASGIIPMSVLENDLPNPQCKRLRARLQACRNICDALTPPRWPPLRLVTQNDLIRLSMMYLWPAVIPSCVILPGEPVRIDTMAGFDGKPVSPASFTVYGNDSEPVAVTFVQAGEVWSTFAIGRGGCCGYDWPQGKGTACPLDAPLDAPLDVCATAEVTLTMQFGRIEPVRPGAEQLEFAGYL